MDQRSFGALFGTYLPQDASFNQIADGIVESMDMQHSARLLSVRIRFAHVIAPTVLFDAERAIATALRINAAVLCPCYAPALLTAEVLPHVIEHLKRRNVAVNGTFEGAQCVHLIGGRHECIVYSLPVRAVERRRKIRQVAAFGLDRAGQIHQFERCAAVEGVAKSVYGGQIHTGQIQFFKTAASTEHKVRSITLLKGEAGEIQFFEGSAVFEHGVQRFAAADTDIELVQRDLLS